MGMKIRRTDHRLLRSWWRGLKADLVQLLGERGYAGA
jgi:hypothetical protein